MIYIAILDPDLGSNKRKFINKLRKCNMFNEIFY
jgi:hypothetical protein